MSGNKCIECGAELQERMEACPNCGCPVEAKIAKSIPESKVERSTDKDVTNTVKNFKFNLFAIVSMLIGVVILFIGISLSKEERDLTLYEAKQYNVESVAFGADFYTEIYGASDTIVDELNSINLGIESLSASLSSFAGIITHTVGMVIIAIGLATISISVTQLKRRD